MNLFGSKKKQQNPSVTPQDAIQKLNAALDNLEKREKHISKRVDKELEDAKKHVAGKNKNAAKMALKRKKMYESQLEKLNGTRMTIEQQKIALENANFNMDILQAMTVGARALQGVNANMTLDKVDETMDQIQEQMDIANEISVAIAQPTMGEFIDDDALEAELAELEAEGLDATLLSVERTPEPVLDLPNAPANKVPVQKAAEEDDELRELENWAAI